ncbi:MAG: phosphoethanolamine--lipid A transferase [Sulfuricurvum sp.]
MTSWFQTPQSNRFITLMVAMFWVLFSNYAFFHHVGEIYALTWENLPFLLSLGVMLGSVFVVLLAVVSFKESFKPITIVVFMIGSFVAYFMDTYNAVIDAHMIQNVLETNIHESLDLFSPTLVGYVLVLGVLPSWILYRTPIRAMSLKTTLIQMVKTIVGAIVVIAVMFGLFSKYYTSFFREHPTLRLYANPAVFIYSSVEYTYHALSHPYEGIAVIGADAHIPPSSAPRKLIIMVVGEAVRWDHFGLNGYARPTTPLLSQAGVINFTQFTSCGTETAVSVPCMFSPFGRENYNGEKAQHTQNVLDVLQRAGVNVLWRDNNSDSKGVALRIAYEDYKTSDKNSVCDEECRDEGMLVGLQDYIHTHPKGNILIVLHQMGNHGPAYFKRYPKNYETFTPVCQSNQLEQCSQQSIINAYDNAIIYTDAFLNRTIALLKENDDHFATAMMYVSDHGESLGEKGLYLHGFPYAIAPEAQKHVPAVMWFGKNFTVDARTLHERATQPQSQDTIFHTLLGMNGVQTQVYQRGLDLVNAGR